MQIVCLEDNMHEKLKPSPAEPWYTLPLQTVQIQMNWLLKKPTDLICTVCHSVCKFISTTWIKQSDWLKIGSGRDSLIYSAWQGIWFPNLWITLDASLAILWSGNIHLAWNIASDHYCGLFVCVEVLRPSQPNGIMSSVVSLPRAVELPCSTCPACPISLRTSKKFQFTCPGTRTL